MSKRRLDVGDGVGAGKMLKEDTGTYVLTILLLLELEHSCDTKGSLMLLFLFSTYWCSQVIPYLCQFFTLWFFFRARQCEARNQDESAHCSPLHTTILRPLSEEDHLARLGVPRQVPWHFRQTPMYLSCWRDRVWENYTNPSMVSSKNSIIFVIYLV